MVALCLDSWEDVRQARECVRDLARAAGIRDASAVVLAVGELGNNCIEHGERAPALLRIGCAPGYLSLRFENRCARRPCWRSAKPLAVEQFRTGGYGLQIVQMLAWRVDCRWTDGRVIVQADFR